ncbi:putative soyasaponin III rhamnosyltransferase [Helianthus annuus]|nr:putative soyasaponin III rhamnosyltransferase [Helianthus annuus]
MPFDLSRLQSFFSGNGLSYAGISFPTTVSFGLCLSCLRRVLRTFFQVVRSTTTSVSSCRYILLTPVLVFPATIFLRYQLSSAFFHTGTTPVRSCDPMKSRFLSTSFFFLGRHHLLTFLLISFDQYFPCFLFQSYSQRAAPYFSPRLSNRPSLLLDLALIPSVDWIIYDFAPYWLPSVAAGLGISRAFFSIFNAWFIVFLGASPEGLINSSDTAEDFLTLRKWIPFPSKLCLRKHEAISFVGHFSGNGSGVSDAYRVGMVLKGSDCMFIRHSYEFEPQWLTLLEKLHQLLVVPVGLVPPETPINIGSEKDETWVPIKKWLDDQQKGHVVYIALGSEVMVSKTEMAELALGLELSRLPFFWALRKPVGSKELNLQDGFLERTRDRGVVWTSWVPQLQILNHESVGGFLNARILVDKQVGIEVPRNEEDGSFTKESVARSVRSVVVDDEGKICKANAMELSQIFGDTKLEKTYINHFIDYLEKKRGVVAINDET